MEMLLRCFAQSKCWDVNLCKFPLAVNSKSSHFTYVSHQRGMCLYHSFSQHHEPATETRRTASVFFKLSAPEKQLISRAFFCQHVTKDDNSTLSSALPGNENKTNNEDNNTKDITARAAPAETASVDSNLSFSTTASQTTKDEILSSFSLYCDFVTPAEEQQLLKEADRHLQRLRYQFSHWDDAIAGYRETEVSRWSRGSEAVLQRLRARAFGDSRGVLVHTHVLDLAREGYIKPHVDSVRFCGSTIAGMSLGSVAVMRLVKVQESDQSVDILLPARSLYIMRDASRYLYTHEVLREAQFQGQAVNKQRRVSIICRNHPPAPVQDAS